MKKTALGLLLLALATSLFAADPVTPSPDRRTVFSFSTGGTGGDVEARRTFMGGRYVVIGLLGYNSVSFDSTTLSGSSHAFELGAGLRRNFTLTDQIRPFAQIEVLRSNGASLGLCSASPAWHVGGMGGAEYFVNSRVSVEGTAGVFYGRSHQSCSGDPVYQIPPSSTTTKTLNTFRTAVALNFYF